MLSKLLRRLRYWTRSLQRQDDLAEELSSHLHFHIDELMEEGLSRKEAEARARARFGNVTRVQEEARSVWVVRWADDLVQDLRYAWRNLHKEPGFAAVVILSSALGIGACSAIFAIGNFLLLGQLQVPQPDRIVTLSRSFRGGAGETISYPVLLDLRSREQSFEAVAGYSPLATGNLGSEGVPTRMWGSVVTANFFDVLELTPEAGHFFGPEADEIGTPAAVVLSERIWRNQLGADASLIGKQIRLNGESTTLLGVAPAGFNGVEVGLASDFWIPLGMVDRSSFMNSDDGEDRLARFYQWLGGVARLRDAVSMTQAQADVNVLARQLEAEYPEFADQGFEVAPAGKINPAIRGAAELGIVVLLGVTVLVLLIACANVANLLLARSATRHQEIATRLAIGASRIRIIKQLLTESVLLALLGGGLGMLLARGALRLLSSIQLPLPIPVVLSVGLDTHVILFVACISVLTGIVFGLVPALRATRRDLTHSLKQTPSHGRRWSLTGALVATQVAASAFLLIATGLLLRSLTVASQIDPGIRTTNLLFASIDPRTNGYGDQETLAFLNAATERIAGLPGVRSVSYTNGVPLSLGSMGDYFVTEDHRNDPQDDYIRVERRTVGPAYFETLGIPLLQGREFGRELPNGEPVVIVNEEFVRRAFGNQDRIGRRIVGRNVTYRIIGVVATGKNQTIGEDPTPAVFMPAAQALPGSGTPLGITMAVQTAAPAATLAAPVRAEIAALDPTMPVFDVKTVETHLDSALLVPRLASLLFGLCGGAGLLIAMIGVYGVVSFSIARRTNEFGIRMALGARRPQIIGTALRGGLWMIGIGLVIGTGLAAGGMRVVASLLYGISPTDPVTFLVVPLLLGSIALLAALAPARRVAMLDPAETLRQE